MTTPPDPGETTMIAACLACIPPGARILEAGTGAGHVAQALARHGTLVATYEPDPEIAAHARTLGLPCHDGAMGGTGALVPLHRSSEFWNNRIGAPPVYGEPTDILTVRQFAVGGLIHVFEPEVLVLDCEGSEYAILRSPLPRPLTLIVCETHPLLLRKELYAALHRHLLTFGWSPLTVPLACREGLNPIIAYQREPTHARGD